MSLNKEIAKLISIEIDTKNYSYGWLADEVGIEESNLRKRLNGKGGLSADQIFLICIALNIDYFTFYSEKLKQFLKNPHKIIIQKNKAIIA